MQFGISKTHKNITLSFDKEATAALVAAGIGRLSITYDSTVRQIIVINATADHGRKLSIQRGQGYISFNVVGTTFKRGWPIHGILVWTAGYIQQLIETGRANMTLPDQLPKPAERRRNSVQRPREHSAQTELPLVAQSVPTLPGAANLAIQVGSRLHLFQLSMEELVDLAVDLGRRNLAV